MRKALFFAWLLVPVGAAAYHYGPGQDRLTLDKAGERVAAAEQLVGQAKWADAVKEFDAALALLPASRTADIRRLRLERDKAQMQCGGLPEARADLDALVAEMSADKMADPAVLTDARNTLASSQFYMTWLMRLEGLPREAWEPEIDAARQTYKLLAEQAVAEGATAAAKKHGEDLEAAIRLARMELKDLQGQNLPCQCTGCCSGSCKKPGKKQGKKPGQKKEDARGAGLGPPPDGSGS